MRPARSSTMAWSRDWTTAHFYVSTTTGASASVYREMQRRIARMAPRLHAAQPDGPHGGDESRRAPEPHDPRALHRPCRWMQARFPYQGVACGRIAGVEARVLRVGFVGELGYEIHVPADQALQVWAAAHRCRRRRGPAALRRGSAARAAPREGPCDRGAGYGRPHQPSRSGTGLDREDGQALLRRSAQPRRSCRSAATVSSSSRSVSSRATLPCWRAISSSPQARLSGGSPASRFRLH